eukprot:m.55866 g.55866  ORF g.55866 m.55866 type:complete len:514 (+) comp13665_c0_seq3:67-1608(+)
MDSSLLSTLDSITLQLEQCLVFADIQLARADASIKDAEAIFTRLNSAEAYALCGKHQEALPSEEVISGSSATHNSDKAEQTLQAALSRAQRLRSSISVDSEAMVSVDESSPLDASIPRVPNTKSARQQRYRSAYSTRTQNTTQTTSNPSRTKRSANRSSESKVSVTGRAPQRLSRTALPKPGRSSKRAPALGVEASIRPFPTRAIESDTVAESGPSEMNQFPSAPPSIEQLPGPIRLPSALRKPLVSLQKMMSDMPLIDTTCVQQAGEEYDASLSFYVEQATMLEERFAFALALPPSHYRSQLLTYLLLQLERALPTATCDNDQLIQVCQEIEELVTTHHQAVDSQEPVSMQTALAKVSPSWLLSEQAVIEHVQTCFKPKQHPFVRASSSVIAPDRTARQALPNSLHRHAWQLPIGWWLGNPESSEESEGLATLMQPELEPLHTEIRRQDHLLQFRLEEALQQLETLVDDYPNHSEGRHPSAVKVSVELQRLLFALKEVNERDKPVFVMSNDN